MPKTKSKNTNERVAKDTATKHHTSPNPAKNGEAVPEPMPVTAVIVADDPVGWALRINGHLEKGVASWIMAGRDLITAKAQLVHGQFEALFKEGKIRIDERTGQMLMRCARNQALSKPHNHSFLPSALNTLHTLSKVEGTQLQAAIDAHKISPAMTTKDAKVLVAELVPAKAKPATTPAPPTTIKVEVTGYGEQQLDESFKRIAAVLVGEFNDCPDSAWKSRLAAKLAEYIKVFGGAAGADQARAA